MATARRCRNAASRLTRRKSRCAARSRSGPMAEGDTVMNSARERLWHRLKIIAREQRLYVTGGCAGYNRAEFHHSRRRTGRRDTDRDHRRGDGATEERKNTRTNTRQEYDPRLPYSEI